MKGTLTYLSLLWLLMGCLSFGFGRTLEVCADCEYQQIAAALAATEDGDVVKVGPGHYFERELVIKHSIRFLGEGWPIIDGGHEGQVLMVAAHDVEVSGFIIQNVGVSYTEDRAGIRIKSSRNCLIRNNELRDTFFGIYLEHSADCRVENNRLFGKAEQEASSGNAIHLWYCNNIEILDNTVRKHRDGIYLEFVDSSLVRGNDIRENLRYGLHFMFSNYDSYLNNHFSDNGAGVAVMFSRYIEMRDNLFAENWGPAAYGLLLKEIFDSEITGNTFYQNTTGIYAEGATRVMILENTFQYNGWALKALGSCMDNRIERNNFLSNSFDLVTNSPRNYNIYASNYWSAYTGYDLDHDGIGDVPYRPVRLYSVVIGRVPSAIVLIRSLFVDIIDFSEKVIPSLTPENLADTSPRMRPYAHSNPQFADNP